MLKVDEIKNGISIFLKDYISKANLENIAGILADNITYIGNKEKETYSGKENVIKILKRKINQFTGNLKIQSEKSILNIINEKTVIVNTQLIIKSSGNILYEPNITFTVIKDNNFWKISMIHNSKLEVSKVDDLKKLKEEIAIIKSSMDIAISQSGVYYYEYNKYDNSVDVNESIMKLLGVESHIDNYPEVIFKNGLVLEEDIDIYREKLNDIRSEREKQVSFDVRLNMPDGGICWFRKHFISITDSQGKVVKIIGVMSNINQLKNIEKSIFLEQNQKFNSEKALRFYYKINLSKGLVLEQKEKLENEIIIKKDKLKYEDFLINKLKKIVDEEKRNYFFEKMNEKSFMGAYLKNENIELEYRRKIDKAIIWVRLRIVFLLEPQSNDILAFGYVYDISKEKESLLMLDAVMMNQNEYILRKELLSNKCYIYASENNFMNFSKGLSNYTIDQYNEKLGFYLEKLKICGDKNHLKLTDEYKNIEKNVLNVKLCEFKNEDNKRSYKRIIYFLDKYSSLYMLVLDVTDVIFNERKVKRELVEALKKAEDIAISAEKSRRDANRANSIKTDFLARMSHDMRTPMSAIIGLANFGLEESIDTRDRKYFQGINDSSEYLLQLINDILDMQTLESGKILLEPQLFKIKDFIKKIETIIKPKADKKGVILNINVKPEIIEEYLNLDKKRLSQILINILNNGVKYTKSGNRVDWNLSINKKNENKWELINKIVDSGVGMSEKFLEHIYEPFSKEYNELSKNEGGTGLGLAITKNLVDNMGGNIFCKSILGKETVFEISIPYKISRKNDAYSKTKILRDSNKKINFKNKKVLLCEDVEINIKILNKILESEGFIVDSFENGALGIEGLKNSSYDIILMDIRMPVMDGITAVTEIRKFNKDIPIIALSANAYADDIEKSLEAGMNAHLSKPINKNELFETIGKLIK